MSSNRQISATGCTGLLQKLSIGGPATDNVSAAGSGAAHYNNEKSANLLSLPNELLYQIVSYLVPTHESIPQAYGFSAFSSGSYIPECVASLEDSDESDDDDDSEIPRDSIAGPIARNAHADAIGLLLDLAPVGKKLAPVVQEVLYVHVSLPQPRDAPSPDTRYTSSISRFLQTIINRPDLAARVKQVSVWIYKGKAFSHFAPAHPDHPMGTSDPAFRVMLDQAMKNLSLKDADFEAWRQNFPRPTEAMICGLVFAALAKLQTVAIYERPFPTPRNNEYEEHKLRNLYARSDEAEIACLSHGLAVTKIHSLALSANLNGLHRAGLPSLTTLQLNYSEPNPFVTVGKGNFINVTF
ncbi:hypothetical protein FB567DRAFT_617275 [Paraphoma chrysanthemicola]|uniref:Uncharacterized protein n=1 Tax=Paraphoma chrysanthemicola TaxID=798071 RepID=A0A8K0RFI4_9PLEO|nr:hypothetical protein FB567DRAFT_617275 [Paraphoma chrysanthemicola]